MPAKIHHPEPLKTIYYWEMKKQGWEPHQKTKFQKALICEENQLVKIRKTQIVYQIVSTY